MTWVDVKKRLAEGVAAIVSIGSGAKQHGQHLPMATDQIQAEWFASRIAGEIKGVVWPTLTYGHYPAFVAYAGNLSLSAGSFVAVVVEIIQQLSGHGAGAIVLVDTDLSTIEPIDRAIVRAIVTTPVIHIKVYSGARFEDAVKSVSEQCYGSHADEIETSLMLVMAPASVNVSLAQASPGLKETYVRGPLNPTNRHLPNYAPSGSFGDPTLATRKKGEVLLAAIL